jgi:methionyl-tRNA formyltransferase
MMTDSDNDIRITFFGGGVAGQIAARRLHESHRDIVVGIVWDESTGSAPDIPDLRTYNLKNCIGSGNVLMCSGYGRKVSKGILESFSGRAFNAHPSLLPFYRGRHAIQWAVSQGERVLGVTVHTMTDEIDEGEAIMFRAKRFGVERKYPDIASELAGMAASMLVELCDDLRRGALHKPGYYCLESSSYWTRRKPVDGKICWSMSSAKILDLVRAGGHDYPAFSSLPDGTEVSFLNYLASETNGEILYSSSEGCLIATIDGVVWLVPDRILEKGVILP